MSPQWTTWALAVQSPCLRCTAGSHATSLGTLKCRPQQEATSVICCDDGLWYLIQRVWSYKKLAWVHCCWFYCGLLCSILIGCILYCLWDLWAIFHPIFGAKINLCPNIIGWYDKFVKTIKTCRHLWVSQLAPRAQLLAERRSYCLL